VPGFTIETFRAAFWGSLVISLVSWLLNIFIGGDGRMVHISSTRKDGDKQ
jgi:uncharacterized membrane protein YvlD (DUF360 family)